MKLIEKKGNLLDEECDYLVHCTNCFGVMGGGIALQIKNTYPGVYEEYKKLCDSTWPKMLFGTEQIVATPEGSRARHIANVFGQYTFGSAAQELSYDKFETALRKLASDIASHDGDDESVVIGFPKFIGCGLAGGKWDVVKDIIENVFGQMNFTVLIVEYSK